MTTTDRRTLYLRMHQDIGAAWHTLPDVADIWRDDDASMEWYLHNALDNALHAVMDVLAALKDVTEDASEGPTDAPHATESD
jgi:hypothetical protein